MLHLIVPPSQELLGQCAHGRVAQQDEGTKEPKRAPAVPPAFGVPEPVQDDLQVSPRL
jgi:hypothetical protein